MSSPRIFADLHTHSRFSRATSPTCTLASLHRMAQIKGVTLVGTGDFTHPEQFRDLEHTLVPAAPGLFALQNEAATAAAHDVPEACRAPVTFMLTGEISSIYKRDGCCRKIHSIVTAPSLEAAARINTRLNAIGNIHSDGRPILGLDPRDLFDLILEADPNCMLIPAHIWTPWFALLGSKSGFDTVEACFGPYTRHLVAVETGLSSDPPMNWRIPCLDAFTLISNSDLHSPGNLGRNATCFYGEPDYFRLFDALAKRDATSYGGTIDLYPEAGKYYYDGHRSCDISFSPEESLAHHNLCPVCGRALTLGVLHRVHDLATRPTDFCLPGAAPCRYIIPLAELVGECLGVRSVSRKVVTACATLTARFGPELAILLDLPTAAVAAAGIPRLDEALENLRAGRVRRTPGYDGVYGSIRAL